MLLFEGQHLPFESGRAGQVSVALQQIQVEKAARPAGVPASAAKVGSKFAQEFRKNKAIMGIFEGCMGMYDAMIPDELLNPTGVFKERLS
jgi:hypothetical protein